jgi:hypothetical protein
MNDTHGRAILIYSVYRMNAMYKMVKNIRIHDQTYEHLSKNNRYPESMADTLDRLLGLKAEGKNKK